MIFKFNGVKLRDLCAQEKTEGAEFLYIVFGTSVYIANSKKNLIYAENFNEEIREGFLFPYDTLKDEADLPEDFEPFSERLPIFQIEKALEEDPEFFYFELWREYLRIVDKNSTGWSS